jgi:hypothetical protein
MTEEAQLYTAMNSEGAKKLREMVPAIKDASMNAVNSQKVITQKSAEALLAGAEASKRFGGTMNVLAFESDARAKVAQSLQMTEANLRNQGIKSSQDAIDRENKARDNLTKAQNSQAGAVAQQAGAAKYQGEWIMNLLNEMFTPLKPVLMWLVNTFKEFAPKVLGFGKDLITQLVIPLFHDVFHGLNLNSILKPFEDFFEGFMGGKKLDLGGIEKGLASVLVPLVDGLRALFGAINWVAVGAGVRFVFDTLIDVGKFVGRILFDAINIAIGVFNILSSSVTAVYNILDYLLAPFGGFSGIVETLTPLFTSMGDYFNNSILPALDTAGSSLTDFAKWINESTRIIQGPLKFSLDLLRAGIVGVVTWMGILKAAQIVSWGIMQIRDKWETLQIVWMMRKELMEKALAFTSNLVKVGFATLLGPVGLAILAVGSLVALFYSLYSNGFTFKTAIQELGLMMWYLKDSLWAFVDWVRGIIPGMGLSDEDLQKNKEQRDKNAIERARQQSEIDAENAKVKKERESASSSPATAVNIENISNPLIPSVAPVSPTSSPSADQAAGERQRRADLTTKKSEDTSSKPREKDSAASANNSQSEEWHKKHTQQMAKLNDNVMLMIQAQTETANWTRKVASGVGSKGNLLRI